MSIVAIIPIKVYIFFALLQSKIGFPYIKLSFLFLFMFMFGIITSEIIDELCLLL